MIMCTVIGKKSDVTDKNLVTLTKKLSRKIVVSAGISLYDTNTHFLYYW